jgi:hypothetical protein
VPVRFHLISELLQVGMVHCIDKRMVAGRSGSLPKDYGCPGVSLKSSLLSRKILPVRFQPVVMELRRPWPGDRDWPGALMLLESAGR